MHPVRSSSSPRARAADRRSLSPELAHSLREWGCVGERSPAAEALPSLAIEDDPCPRRRHARTVLQRMLRMGKVGPGYHTEFDHFAGRARARGPAPSTWPRPSCGPGCSARSPVSASATST